MNLSQIKNHLNTATSVNFQLPDGTMVPKHFHVTEVGEISKHFIDCGGTVRHEKVASFQLWNTIDEDHLLKPEKLLKIIALSEKVLGLGDLEIEVEYQGDTIGKYGLDIVGEKFLLTSKQTDCLAKDKCGVPPTKTKLQLVELPTSEAACCAPGCCQ